MPGTRSIWSQPRARNQGLLDTQWADVAATRLGPSRDTEDCSELKGRRHRGRVFRLTWPTGARVQYKALERIGDQEFISHTVGDV